MLLILFTKDACREIYGRFLREFTSPTAWQGMTASRISQNLGTDDHAADRDALRSDMSHLNENDLTTISSRRVIRPSCHRGKPGLGPEAAGEESGPGRDDDRHAPESIPEDRSVSLE